MREPEETPDRRPVLYALFAVVILAAAVFLFRPQGNDQLVLTPESVRETGLATQDAAPTETAQGSTPAAPSSGDRSDAGTATVELGRDPAPVPETEIVDARPQKQTLEPATPAPRATPRADGPQMGPQTQGAWVINVGSFSTRPNADNRVQALARAGVTAFVEEGNANGKKVFRVRVGYFPSREAATAYGSWLKKTRQIESWPSRR